ncbi:MAG: signal peptidase I [Bacillota bacterium]
MKEKPVNKTVSLIKTTLFFAVIGILFFYILLEIFMPRQTINIVQVKPFIVVTQSMEPVINVDDLAFVRNVDIDKLEEEDIITFYADINYDGEEEIVTHYIYSIDDNGSGEPVIRTRRYFEDEDDIIADTWQLSEEDIIGQYMFKIPKIGVPIRFLQSPFGIAALVVNAAVITGIVILLKEDKKKTKMVDNNDKNTEDKA